MAKRRKAVPVTLTASQRERLERLWFYYGNYGPKTTPGNHSFIQGLLEHGLDLRPLRNKQTRKSEIPTPECEAAVDAVLASNDEGTEQNEVRAGSLHLVPSTDEGPKPAAPDPEMKEILEDARRRQRAQRESAGHEPDDRDAA